MRRGLVNLLVFRYHDLVRTRRVVVLMLGAVVLICIAFVYAFSSPPPSAILPDGTTLHVTGAKVGFTNEFLHGNRVEKLLGNLIPTNGMSLGKWQLQRPERQQFGWSTNATTLSVQLHLTGQSNQLKQSELFNRPPFYRKFRFVHWGNDGFRYTEEIQERYFSKRRDGYFGYLNTTTFARSSDMLHLEVHQRDVDRGDWKTIGRIDFKNPNPTAFASWATKDFPVTNEYDGFTAVLGTIQVQQPRDHATLYRDIWQHHISVPFKFFIAGKAVTNWNAEQIHVFDATGNENFLGASTAHTNGWVVKRGFRSSNPFVPWKLTGHFVQESEFDPSDLITISLPIPLAVPLSTNFLGTPLTLNVGSGDMLSVELPSKPRNRRLIVAEVLDQEGDAVQLLTGSWGQHGLRRRVGKVGSKLSVTLAIVRDIEFEFIVQPELVESVSPPPPL